MIQFSGRNPISLDCCFNRPASAWTLGHVQGISIFHFWIVVSWMGIIQLHSLIHFNVPLLHLAKKRGSWMDTKLGGFQLAKQMIQVENCSSRVTRYANWMSIIRWLRLIEGWQSFSISWCVLTQWSPFPTASLLLISFFKVSERFNESSTTPRMVRRKLRSSK